MIHLPVLRAGQPYKSLSTVTLKNFRTGEAVAEVSQANPGLIARDFASAEKRQSVLSSYTVPDLIQICEHAASLFLKEALPLDDATTQTPDEYVSQTSATTGMPQVMCKKNMQKIAWVLENMRTVLEGLTRGLDLSILDNGFGRQGSTTISYLCATNTLGAILPNNSPGVHSLWLPAVPLKVPLALKPGREEPWTPYRIAQAFLKAGCPPEAFGYYPTDYNGASEILMRCDRVMMFGDESTVRKWEKDRRVEIHGPGKSKILIGEDQIENWSQHLEVIVSSIAENGGRSCINASGVWVPRNGREIADRLAQDLVRIQALPMDHPDAVLAAFANPLIAKRINDLVEQQLRIPGAEDITANYRKTERCVEVDGCTFLLPTVVWCENPEHPLANTEFLFPFAAVVEVPQPEMLERIGPSLIVSALTEDSDWSRQLLTSRNVDRLNLGAVPTCRVSWDQPHEGNLFEHLYRQRSFQSAS